MRDRAPFAFHGNLPPSAPAWQWSLVLRQSVPAALRPHLELLRLGREAHTSRYDARFAKYLASYGDPETFLLHQAESFRDANMQGATVLDFGCGFGLIGSMFAALGAARVVGVDMDGSMIDRGRSLIAEWLPPEVQQRVELRNVNALEADLPSNTFSVITAIESLSHVQSVTSAIQLFRRVIQPRGRVMVSDGNNSFYLPGRRRRRKIWDEWEARVAGPARQAALQKALPGLHPPTLTTLVRETLGLSEARAVAAAKAKLEHGIAPVAAPSRRMVHPRTGYHEERELDPFELMRRFEDFEFVGRLLLPHADFPQRLLSQKALLKRGLRRLYPLSLPAFPGFRVLLTDTRTSDEPQ